MNKYITDVLSDTTEINQTQRTIRAYLDDKGNEFFTVFCNEDMLAEYGIIYTRRGQHNITVNADECMKIIQAIEDRQKEL